MARVTGSDIIALRVRDLVEASGRFYEERTGWFELAPLGPYSISASARFLEGFAPAHYEGGGPEHLRFAFVADGLDRGEKVAGVHVYSEGEKVIMEPYGEAAPETVRDQIERILSLDVDGSGFPRSGSVIP